MKRELSRQVCAWAAVAALGVAVVADAAAMPVKKLAPYIYEAWYDSYEECDLTGDDGPFGDLSVVSVPVAFSRRNVPIGVQVIGNTFDDLTAMRVAAALSKVVKPNFRDGRIPDFRNVK